ncbi:GPN-loop GTPase 1 [Fulvia fulva]|uniref:GPN-loop GTPase n=1 Tax=Passalora fulva TaxID=5499 RepID=A0A9Q8P4E2_PASFU|nr:GPN-loop GTPase 1 [Fulvia fulva]KAK4635388.1 GPN-loop GTPase 1 [Fulvia fulva]KAK4638194.1 GPN-loop GTPase 1 [Fulvia fulva]UJO12764.1 GPN-loop GTPase 1 [Fulvia fulva]WPV09533.1 GPN-loop GTPase 1 [Fulvia fulva]WPV24740.1 GPN-loop GTPase 1 [Fulvia fulva]
MASAGTQAPVAVVCVGMAGSGKTTFMQRINAHLHTQSQSNPPTQPPYVMNLDPAVRSVPFDSNIDIRDSVNYKEVMKQYNLGPNGGILTSLNLFSTKIDQVMGILEKRCLPQESAKPLPSHIIVDTPGQIEVFVWSASGNILLNSLASSFPTVIAYVIDTPRTTENTSTFMSNMLYAISILYKTKLPMILVFNKTDVKSEEQAVDWMRDFESFQNAVRAEEDEERSGAGYMGPLLNSMTLVLEEFYNQLSVVGVSSMTGDGVEDFFKAIEEKRVEFDKDYKPELERRRAEAEEQKTQIRESEVNRMMKDMNVSSKAKGTGKYAKPEPETVSEAEEDDEEGEGDNDGELVEPDEINEEDEVNEAFEQGLKARYEAALRDGGASAWSKTGQAANYIRSSQR